MGREIEMRTERLVLRSFRASDVDDALVYRNDPEFARFLPHIPQPFTRPDAESTVNFNVDPANLRGVATICGVDLCR